MDQIICFLCGNKANKLMTTSSREFGIECNICGEIHYTCAFANAYIDYATNLLSLKDAQNNPLSENKNEKAKIILRYYFKTNSAENPTKAEQLMTSNFESIITSVNYPASLLDKIDLVLEYIHQKTNFFHESIEILTYTDYPLFYCKDSSELINILIYLEKQNYISFSSNEFTAPTKTTILPEGIKYIQESSKTKKSNQCFVAMSFSNGTKDVWSNYIKPSIEETNYSPIRIDEVEHTENITNKIISEIRKSKFMIVDLTDNRNGVYFEAGFGFGLGLPIIYTCKKDHLDNVHFDLKQQNMILWETDKLDEFKETLINRIGAVIA